VVPNKKKRRFTKEAWERLMATVRPEASAPAEEKKETTVEVHVHNNLGDAAFHRGLNSADYEMERLKKRNRL
jgi:hypothetical protein